MSKESIREEIAASSLQVAEHILDRVMCAAITTEDNGFVQGLLERGELRRARATIIRLGQLKFGPLAPERRAAIERIEDMDRLDILTDRIVTAASWEELLSAQTA
ncbi:MAG: hypothetical protein K2W96_26385 [Gemmataceae bacterium]|nr:hypothetical protein [Gemmataceae bacterium]